MAFENEHEDEHEDGLLLTDELQEAPEAEEVEKEPAEQEDDPLELSIEGEDDGNENELVRRLRDQVRTSHREIAALKKAPVQIEVGKKPDLWEDCDGDPDKFETALLGWNERKRQASQAQTDQQTQAETKAKEFERLKARHDARAVALRIPDFETKQQAVIDALGPELAGAAMVIADDSAKLVGALGANPAALAKIADEPDMLLKLKLIMKMESRITVKKKPPEPEAKTIQRGSAPLGRVDHDKKLAQLEAAAEKSGKRDAVIAYKKQMKAKAA